MSDLDHRVLFIAPTPRDAQITQALLGQAGVICETYRALEVIVNEIKRGAGALLLTDDAIATAGSSELLRCLAEQPSWSDLPVVMLAAGGDRSPVVNEVVRSLTNLTLLERPTAMRSLISAVQSAIRARQKQYLIRDQLETIRAAEERANQLKEQLTIAVDASALGTFHCEIPLGKLQWNDKCKSHFWLPPDAEVDIDRFYSILHPDDQEKTRQAVDACVNHGELFDVEYRTVSPTGATRWVRATGKTFRDGNGVPVRFDGTTQDVTDRKQMEEFRTRVLLSERKARNDAEHAGRMKDEFLATLSHELRTPLNVIYGWTQLLRRGKDNPLTVERAVDVIERNVRAQSHLIEDLLDMNRIIAGKVRLEVTSVNVPEIIQSAMDSTRPSADAKGINLHSDVGELPIIRGDAGRLQQILWNLLSNAVKFTPKGGDVAVHAWQNADELVVTVVDSGEGIGPEFLPVIFERFSQADGSTTRKHSGLGLGLSIVKTLVEMHGGTIEATSDGIGKGSTFTVSLPLHAGVSSAGGTAQDSLTGTSEDASHHNTATLKGVNVLVVDDEQDAREMMLYILRQWDIDATSVGSAKEAEAVLARSTPDVIISDIAMPEKDGFEFIRTLRKNNVTIPAMALSAFARNEDREQALRAGFQLHMAKPIDSHQLEEALQKLIAHRSVIPVYDTSRPQS